MTDAVPMGDLDLPALEPPDGVTPNFTNPPNKNGLAYATLGICVSLSSVVIAIRIYTRLFLLRRAHFGDYTLVIAWGVYLGAIGVIYNAVKTYGLFIHEWDIQKRNIANHLRVSFQVTNLYIVCFPLLKIAICLEWLHLFCPTGSRNFVFWASWLVLFANAIFYIICLVLYNVCSVSHKETGSKVVHGSCDQVNIGTLSLIGTVFNLVMDLAIFMIPQKIIWSLNLAGKKKLGVSTVFSIGLFACGSATARLVLTSLKNASLDFTYTFSAIAVCGLAEGLCGILVMCLPALPRLFAAIDVSHLMAIIRSWSLSTRLQHSRKSPETSWPSSHEFQRIRNPDFRSHFERSDNQEEDVYRGGPRLETAASQTTRFEAEPAGDAYASGAIHQTRHLES